MLLCFYAFYCNNGLTVQSFIISFQVGSIFTLTYVPSGNAKLQSDGTLKCQHGPMECLINKVDACLLHYYPDRYGW